MPSRRPFALLNAALVAALLASAAPMATGLAQVSARDRSAASPAPANAPPADDRIDINHASLEELLKVPGMTPTWAGRIARFRPYRTKQDLLDHGVLPSGVYDRVKGYLIAHHAAQ
jgi:DNA uptake protein ComE-like DNA-binding protein